MNGWKRAVGIAGLLLLPTLLAVLLANWFDSRRTARSSEQNVSSAQRAAPPQPEASAAAATRPATKPAHADEPAAPTRHASLNEYAEAVEQRREARLDAAFNAGASDPAWTAEVSAYAKDALGHLEHGGALRSVECRSTLCRVVVDVAKVDGISVDEIAPMPHHDQRTFAAGDGKGGATLTYYLAPEGQRLKWITENQVK
jgi:hypothetical protein